MSVDVKIRKGVDIRLKGKAENISAIAPKAEIIAIKPTDFPGLLPKLVVKVGDKVKAGSPLFSNKINDKILFTSTVSGEVIDVKRGAKRKIEAVVVKADSTITYESFKQADPATLSREEIIDQLLKSGAWPFITQRPYDIVANPTDVPKAIFISAFDSSPLAADNDFIVHGQEELFRVGLSAITKLTDGKVHLNVSGNTKPHDAFTSAKGVQINTFRGAHPAGNAGVQAHHIDPVNKGEVVWMIKPQDIIIIGRLFKEGKFDATKMIAVCGSSVSAPKYFKTIIGAQAKTITKGLIKGDKVRLISGNVLTGEAIGEEGYLGYYHNELTAIPEGGEPQFMGWLTPGFGKFSLSRSFFSWLTPAKEYALNTNMNGEERAYVVTGEYDKLFPMNIYPVHLIKAMIIKDIDLMEKLGIYEVAPEDFALCEYACTSKIEVQSIVREALDLVRQECE